MHTADGSLSSGAFGVLYTGRDKAGNEVAIKFSKCGGGPHKSPPQEWYDQFADPRYRPLLLEEVITHKKASSTGNKHVAKLFGAFEESCELREIAAMGCDKPGRRNRLVLVMEKCSGHDLYDVLSTGETLPGVLPAQAGEAPRTRPYNEVDKRGLFKQCAEALEAMHAAGLVHRDIKPENIVMKEKPVPGVLPDLAFIDFGLAIDLERGDIRTGRTGIIGSRNYAAPELFVGENTFAGTENYQPPIDVYAMGVVLFMMLLGFHDREEDYPYDIRGGTYEIMRRNRNHLTFLNPAHPHHAALSKYSPMVSLFCVVCGKGCSPFLFFSSTN
jgi:serine/threonine protein kinase